MADSTPLLLRQDQAIDQKTSSLRENQEIRTSVSLDEFIELHFQGFSFKHFIHAILVSLSMFFDGQQNFISIFTDAEPSWHCIVNTTHPVSAICNSTSNICDLPATLWAWDGPSYQTVISEWGLQCASSIVTGLPASSFFIGCLVGGFALTTLGDSKLGRKNLLFFSCLAMSITATTTIFANNVWMYSGLRFATGFFRAPIGTSCVVLLMEMVGKRWRGQVGIIGFFCFSLGLLSLPGIAYANRGSSWRSVYLWTSIPSIFYCLIAYLFVAESPRWLFIHGREAEADAILKKFSPATNDHTLNYRPLKDDTSNGDPYSSMKNLFNRRWALQWLLRTMGLAFGIGIAYYGILLGVGNLDVSTYLSVTLNGVLDIPAYFLTFVLIERWSRKHTILGFCTLSGVSCILCGLIGHEQEMLQIGLELASLIGVCISFNVLLIYTSELFPTVVRSSASSMVRQAIMLGAVFSPILISAGRKMEFLSYGVFGLAVMCSGFVVIWLPETKGVALCDTMEGQ